MTYADRDERGIYIWNGVEYPSVTRILGMIASSDLQMWYAKMTAEECAGIAQKMIEGIMPEQEGYSELLDSATRMTAPIRYRDHRGSIGTLTHHYLYTRALGEKPAYLQNWIFSTIDMLGLAKRSDQDDYASTLARASEDYIEAAERFLNTYKPEFEAVGLEALVVNEQYGYAGRTDAILTFKKSKWPRNLQWLYPNDEVRLTTDFKTSKHLKDSFRLQLEAYRQADFIGLIEDQSEHRIEKTEGSCLIHIKPDTGAHFVPCTLPGEDPGPLMDAFVALRYIYSVFEELPTPTRVKKVVSEIRKKKIPGKPCPF